MQLWWASQAGFTGDKTIIVIEFQANACPLIFQKVIIPWFVVLFWHWPILFFLFWILFLSPIHVSAKLEISRYASGFCEPDVLGYPEIYKWGGGGEINRNWREPCLSFARGRYKLSKNLKTYEILSCNKISIHCIPNIHCNKRARNNISSQAFAGLLVCVCGRGGGLRPLYCHSVYGLFVSIPSHFEYIAVIVD